MRPLRLGLLAVAGAGAAAAFALSITSCSLGLDESKIDAAKDAGVIDRRNPDADVPDGSNDAGFVAPQPAKCSRDEECTTTHGCLKGRCDPTRKTCVFDVCRLSACTSSACDASARTCGAAAPYAFKAAQFPVGAQVVGRGLAAVHPWLFALTSTGVVAFNVANPAATAPPPVQVVGIGFFPVQMQVSGNRVYFLAGMSGPGPSRIPLAWIDVPADPFATKITAQSVLATYARPAEGVTMYPRSGDGALLVGPGGPESFPTSIVQAPLVEPLTLTPTPLVFTPGSGPVMSSGERLVMQSYNGANATATFSVVTGAGSTSPQNTGDTPFTAAGPVAPPQAFAASGDGAVFWSVTAITGAPNPDPMGPQPTTRALRGFFILPDAAGPLDQTLGVDVEVYAPGTLGVGAAVVGPPVMLDSGLAMVAAAAKENTAQATSVQFVRRNPLDLVKNADNTTPRRAVLPVPVANFAGAAASNGIGYLVANEAGPPANATVYVFDPGCAP